MCSTDNFWSADLHVSKVQNMLHHGLVGRVQNKECSNAATLCFLYFMFWHFHFFHHKICVVIIFISFSDEVSNFRNRILINQKQELVIRNCQWNCMLWKCESMKKVCVRSPMVNSRLNSSSSPTSRRNNKIFQNNFIS